MDNNQHNKSQRRSRRLQREPTPDGFRVSTFEDVLKRHGLTMFCLALIAVLLPSSWALIANTMTPLTSGPRPYVLALVFIIVFFIVWTRRQGIELQQQVPWLTYLLMISIVEEVTFRLVLPELLHTQIDYRWAHVVSNLIFACIHYFTLRWRMTHCIATFFGGMGLSHLMAREDLVLVILVHWVGTFINTPSSPSSEPLVQQADE